MSLAEFSISNGLPLRQRLRQQTSDIHKQLDAAVGEFDSITSYMRYLNAQHAFREGVESALQAAPSGIWPSAWRPRHLTADILQDMQDLGVRAECPVPKTMIENHLKNVSGLLGVVYVLEGSTLGARVLQRRAFALGLSPHHGARHLAVQAEDRTSWPQYLNILNAREDLDADAASAAAIATFNIAYGAFAASAR